MSFFDATNGDLKVLKCGNNTCNSGNTSSIAFSATATVITSSISTGYDGLAVIALVEDQLDDLRVVHCGNVSCSSSGNTTAAFDIETVEGTPAITIGADGLPLIVIDDSAIKAVHCSNAQCIRFFRTR